MKTLTLNIFLVLHFGLIPLVSGQTRIPETYSYCDESLTEKPGLKNGNSFEEEIAKQLKTPVSKGYDLKVLARFIVDGKGKIREAIIYDAPSVSIGEEIIRIIKNLSNCHPGRDGNGNRVNVECIFEIDYSTNGVKPVADYLDWLFSEENLITERAIGDLLNEKLSDIDYAIPPKFMGVSSMHDFRVWLMCGLDYPAEAVQGKISGKVVASFAIDKKGNVTDIEIETPTHYSLNNEVIRLLKTSPRWTPAYDSDRNPIETRFTIPVEFQVN